MRALMLPAKTVRCISAVCIPCYRLEYHDAAVIFEKRIRQRRGLAFLQRDQERAVEAMWQFYGLLERRERVVGAVRTLCKSCVLKRPLEVLIRILMKCIKYV